MKKLFLEFLVLASGLTVTQSALAANLDSATSHKIQQTLHLQGSGSGVLTVISIITEKADPSLYYRLGFKQADSTLLINSPEDQPMLRDLFQALEDAGVKIRFVNEGTSYYSLQVNLNCTSADSCTTEDLE